MKTAKRETKVIISVVILVIVIIGCIAGYFGYGATMINPDNEKSIINHLSTDKENPIDVLEIKKHKNYVAILYTDPVELGKNKNSSHLVCFIKNKYYSNRYKSTASSGGEQTQSMVHFIPFIDEEKDSCSFCFIANTASEETKCSVFEYDENLLPIKKLDELEVPKTSYIFVKEYELENKYNNILVYDGSIDLEDFTE